MHHCLQNDTDYGVIVISGSEIVSRGSKQFLSSL